MKLKKILGLLFVVIGAIGLILGIIGIFGQNLVTISPWALATLGFIFFLAGMGLVKRLDPT